MPQTVILAPDVTTATSTDVVVAAGSTATVGMYVASGDLPKDASMEVLMDTPAADILVANLSVLEPATVVVGPGTFRVARTVGRMLGGTVGVGAFSET